MAPKRPVEPSAPSAPSGSSTTRDKRVKFAAGAGDGQPAATGDEDDWELETAKRKGAVETDGYGSDSSAEDEGFGVGGGRQGRKAATGEADGDDDEDMFGDAAAEDGDKSSAKKGKGKEFLELGDIEGQEFGKGEDGEDSGSEEDYYEEDDLANTDDAPRSRRSKKGMGYKLSSFNMEDELKEGRFAADGSYVQNNDDPLATHDRWLDDVSKDSIKAARESKRKMDAERKRKEQDEMKDEQSLVQGRDDCLIGLVGALKEGETTARALARLGALRKKLKSASSKRATGGKGKDRMETDEETVVDKLSRRIDEITHMASQMLSTHGELEIYDQTREDIIKTLKSEGAVRRDWVPSNNAMDDLLAAEDEHTETAAASSNGRAINRPLIARPTGAAAASAASAPPASSSTQFEYKWKITPAGQEPNKVHGPYGRSELENWVTAGYFGPGGAAIDVRVVAQAGAQEGWHEWEAARLR